MQRRSNFAVPRRDEVDTLHFVVRNLELDSDLRERIDSTREVVRLDTLRGATFNCDVGSGGSRVYFKRRESLPTIVVPSAKASSSAACAAEDAVASAFRMQDCFIDQPLLSADELQTIISRYGRSLLATSAQIHIAALVALIWIEANIQRADHAIRTGQDLQMWARSLKVSKDSNTGLVFAPIIELWMANRVRSISDNYRPCGIPLVHVGTTKDPRHFLRNDVNHKRLALGIDDGQAALRRGVCAQILQSLATGLDALHAFSDMAPIGPPFHLTSPLFMGNATAEAADVLTAKGFQIQAAPHALQRHRRPLKLSEAERRVVMHCVDAECPGIQVKLAGLDAAALYVELAVVDDGAHVPCLCAAPLDVHSRELVRIAGLDELVRPVVPPCMRELWNTLRKYRSSDPGPQGHFVVIPTSDELLRFVRCAEGKTGCATKHMGVFTNRHGVPSFAAVRVCGQTLRLPLERGFAYTVLEEVHWRSEPDRRRGPSPLERFLPPGAMEAASASADRYATLGGSSYDVDMPAERRHRAEEEGDGVLLRQFQPAGFSFAALVDLLRHLHAFALKERVEEVDVPDEWAIHLAWALECHPRRDAKVGCGVSKFAAGWCRKTGSQKRHFTYVAHRVCGTKMPFCVDQRSADEQAVVAAEAEW